MTALIVVIVCVVVAAIFLYFNEWIWERFMYCAFVVQIILLSYVAYLWSK